MRLAGDCLAMRRRLASTPSSSALPEPPRAAAASSQARAFTRASATTRRRERAPTLRSRVLRAARAGPRRARSLCGSRQRTVAASRPRRAPPITPRRNRATTSPNSCIVPDPAAGNGPDGPAPGVKAVSRMSRPSPYAWCSQVRTVVPPSLSVMAVSRQPGSQDGSGWVLTSSSRSAAISAFPSGPVSIRSGGRTLVGSQCARAPGRRAGTTRRPKP